jgi:hypothetical protein
MYYLFTRICWRESIRVSALSFGGAGDAISHCCSLFEIALDMMRVRARRVLLWFHLVSFCLLLGYGRVGGRRALLLVYRWCPAVRAARDYFVVLFRVRWADDCPCGPSLNPLSRDPLRL